jgi:hypothetical protein
MARGPRLVPHLPCGGLLDSFTSLVVGEFLALTQYAELGGQNAAPKDRLVSVCINGSRIQDTWPRKSNRLLRLCPTAERHDYFAKMYGGGYRVGVSDGGSR